MAAAKKGKKTSSSKKSSKGKKKRGNSNFFMSFMLILLVLAMIVAAVFLTLNNFNINKNDKSQITKEVVVKKEENKNVSKPAAKPAETKKDDSKKESVKKEKAEPKKEETKKETKKEAQRLTNLSGCWLSNEQGAFITLDQYGYRIDFSNVDASKPLTGNYYVENNLIVFTTDGNECKGTEGTYRITFYKKNFSLICKDDDCTSRRNILEADWEWVEF